MQARENANRDVLVAWIQRRYHILIMPFITLIITLIITPFPNQEKKRGMLVWGCLTRSSPHPPPMTAG